MSVHLPHALQLQTTTCPNETKNVPNRILSKQEKDARDGMILCMKTPVRFKPQVSMRVHKFCLHCGTGSTPLWRNDADGNKTLCNACGIKWKRHAKNNKTHETALRTMRPTKKARHNQEIDVDNVQMPFLKKTESFTAPP